MSIRFDDPNDYDFRPNRKRLTAPDMAKYDIQFTSGKVSDSPFDVTVTLDHRALKRKVRFARLVHYWRYLTDPTYRHLWKMLKGYFA